MTNKNNLAHIVVGNVEKAQVFVPKGKRVIVKESVGNTRKANVYFAIRGYEYSKAMLKQVYSAILNQNIVHVIDGKNSVCYDSFDIEDIEERKVLAADVWNVLEDKKEALYPAAMDANYMSYLFGLPDNHVVHLQGYKLEYNASLNEHFRKPEKRALTVATLKKMYYGTMKWASALGWSFEKPLMGSKRTIDEFNTRAFIETGSYLDKEGKAHPCISWDNFTTTPYAGNDDVIPGSEVTIKISLRTKYKPLVLTPFVEVLEFSNYLSNLKHYAAASNIPLEEMLDPGWTICKTCGNPVRKEGKLDNRFCSYCDTEVPDYWVTDCYYDDRDYGYEDYEDYDVEYPEHIKEDDQD